MGILRDELEFPKWLKLGSPGLPKLGDGTRRLCNEVDLRNDRADFFSLFKGLNRQNHEAVKVIDGLVKDRLFSDGKDVVNLMRGGKPGEGGWVPDGVEAVEKGILIAGLAPAAAESGRFGAALG